MSLPNPYPHQPPLSPISRGAFVVIEGLDRAGKTTQVKKLCDTLYAEGHNVEILRFPDRTTPIGQTINSYLTNTTEMDDHAIHLLFSANRWERSSYINQQIALGRTLIVDRYYYSGIVYSASKANPLLPLPWARAPEVGLPRPDHVVFLDLSPSTAEKRGDYGEEKYEKREMQERVRAEFLNLSVRGEEESADMVVIDAGHSIEEVGREILDSVRKVVKSVEGGERGELRRVGAWEKP